MSSDTATSAKRVTGALVLGLSTALMAAGALYLAIPLMPWRIDWPKAIEVGVGVFGNLAAAFFGAAAAFLFSARHQARKQRESEVELCNRALLVLSRQLNFLLHYRTMVLDPMRENPYRHLHLSPSPYIDMNSWRVDAPSLAFLLAGVASEIPFGVALQDERFHVAMQALNERSRIHRDVVQPALDFILPADGSPVDPDLVEAGLGPRLTFTLAGATDQMFEHVTATVQSHERFIAEAVRLLRLAMPGAPFLVARAPREGDVEPTGLAALDMGAEGS